MKLPLLCLVLAFFSTVAGAETTALRWREASADAGGPKGFVQLESGKILATRERRHQGEHQVIAIRSTDGGSTWRDLGIIASEKKRATVGDGHLLQLPSGEILFSYRHNLLGEQESDPRRYSIRVALSEDEGQSWRPHSVVVTAEHDPVAEPKAQRGLWSSFLLLTPEGHLHCVYDDEDTPHRAGFYRHQWLTMRTWDPRKGEWGDPVTVSRAHDPAHLSRDGMPSIVVLPSGRLICAFETVQPAPPHANLIRFTTSDDNGKTWSWQRQERGLLYESPGRPRHLSLSPWITHLPPGQLICVFATDEDREMPGVSGTPPPRLSLDIKYVTSDDDGATWSLPARLIHAGGHRNYMPGVIALKDGTLLVSFIDFGTGTFRAFRGELEERHPAPRSSGR